MIKIVQLIKTVNEVKNSEFVKVLKNIFSKNLFLIKISFR